MLDDFYGLTGKPFQLTPDPAFYFRSATHEKALACLGYGLAQGEAVIVVTGEAGTGKSMLVAHLMGLIDPQQMTVTQIAGNGLGPNALVPVLAQDFGLLVEGLDRSGARDAIEGFLHGEARAGRCCLLIADDAHELSDDALEDLRGLTGLQFGGRPLVQALLLGPPEFRAALQGHPVFEPLHHRVTAAHHLEPLIRAEIEPYIVRRLERVGWSGRPQFDQRVFAELHAASAGVPLRINQIAGRLLRLGAVERRSRIDAVMLKAVLDEMAAERAAAAEPLSADLASMSPPSGRARLVDHAYLVAALAERDLQIAELQQALAELAGQQEAAGPQSLGSALEALGAQVAALEARTGEQDRALRRILGMLIEWIEGEIEPSRAA